jgi:hypothetical protein
MWNWESDRLSGQPANVKIGEWLPQQDILGIMTLYIHNYEQAIAMTMTRETNFFMAKGNICLYG